jgi:DNA-binding NarL/FixJ family response regulator
MDSMPSDDRHTPMNDGDSTPARLTPMQMKILKGVHSGLLNKQIAFHLGIAEATVKAHMTQLMRRLNVRNRTQVALVAQAMDLGDIRH